MQDRKNKNFVLKRKLSVAFNIKGDKKYNLLPNTGLSSKNELPHSYQSSFGTNYSTDTCFSQLSDLILNGAKNGLYNGLILIDLQKAIENFDHKVLSDKIKRIDFSDKTIKRFIPI